MKKNSDNKNTRSFRLLILMGIIYLFVIIGAILFYQYRQYQQIENKLINLYANTDIASNRLNQLFSVYAMAENNFRLYTLDFDQGSYDAYARQLDSIKYYIDSLAALPIQGNPLARNHLDIEKNMELALEFATLKKTMDDLVMHTTDSLIAVGAPLPHMAKAEIIEPDSLVHRILTDTTSTLIQDTLVRQKQRLLKRIFNSKNDTLVVDIEKNTLLADHITVIHKNIKDAVTESEQAYVENARILRNTFLQLQQKERQLITTNFLLLNRLKAGIEKIRNIEIEAQRKQELQGFEAYRKNARVFSTQLLFVLPLMLFMLFAMIYYQRHASSYEQKLKEEKDYAAKLAEEKTSILAGVSHEVRTPLNSLLGIIDLLKSRYAANQKTEPIDEKLIDSCYYSINIISSTINDILNLSRLEASKGNIALEYFSPVKIFKQVLSLHQQQAELKNLTLKSTIDIDPKLKILSNEFRIRQIASNFISNAIKYTYKGEVIFRARIGDKQVLHIEVKDSGIGIANEEKNQIFRKYYTANAPSGGFGLGLYISKILTEELNGKIDFVSRLNEGSTFFADIPFTASIFSERAEKDHGLADLPDHLHGLIVDDNPINILYMKQFFKNYEHLYTANTGVDALNILEKHRVDFVITDINMPLMSGWELLKIIKSSPKYQHIKVLALSADSITTMETSAPEKEELVFDGIITKPFTETELVKTLMKTLEIEQ